MVIFISYVSLPEGIHLPSPFISSIRANRAKVRRWTRNEDDAAQLHSICPRGPTGWCPPVM